MARHYGCVRGFIFGTDQPIADEAGKKPKREGPWKPCMICGNPLPAGKIRYCSYECAKRAESHNAARRRFENPEKYEEQKRIQRERYNERRKVESMRKARKSGDRGLECTQSNTD